MSLTRPSLTNLIKKQYTFKLRSYHGMFSTLIILQCVAILITVFGGGSIIGSGINDTMITLKSYSADTIIGFTYIWIFISSILLTTKAYREEDFTFVTNRLSSHLANVCFLVTASIVGGLTSLLSGFLIKVIMRYIFNVSDLLAPQMDMTLQMFLSGLLATILFMLLFGGLGYILGTMIQMHRMMIFILPVLFFSMLFFSETIGSEQLIIKITKFYFAETSIVLFVCKAIITALLMFIVTLTMSNRLEVRS